MTLTSLLIQVQRWLMQPHVWRFVSFASTVVALLCYALSSSFNHLFGGWNLWKICVYSVLSFIFCFAVLFAKVWQPSNSIRFKAHMAFFVLTITSIYSFFYDKVVNGKPDAYSLISCAAFAVMSLSLSRQTHFGFEVDLLYFFLGALIVQVMKIELLLGFVGACFGYSLIILRSSLNTPLESVYIGIQGQHHVTVQVDSHSQEANPDIDAIMPQLTTCMEAFKVKNPMLIDMLSKHVGEYIKGDVDHIKIDNNMVIDSLHSEIVDDLSEAVKLMVAIGFEKECCDVYSSFRREFLEQFLIGLNLPHVVKIKYLGSYIEIWIKIMNIAMRILFPNEKRLCERVFSGCTSASDLAFMEVYRELTISLLNYANIFAVGSNSPDLWPIIPKAFDTLHGLIPEFESLSPEPLNDSLRNEAINTCKRLAKSTKCIFMELEDQICHDRPGVDFRDVMNYLVGVSEARISLEKVFQENPLAANGVGTSSSLAFFYFGVEESFFGLASSLSMQIAKIMELLDRHLEVKSKIHLDPAMGHVFMMNNRRYIQQRVKESNDLGNILGDDWIQKHNAKVQQNLEDFMLECNFGYNTF